MIATPFIYPLLKYSIFKYTRVEYLRMKKAQKLFALSLSLFLVGCSSPKPQPIEIKDKLTYIMTKNEVHVRATNKDIAGEVNIPETYKGLPVTFIIANAFYNCKNVTKVSLPKSIREIDINAFYGCSSLTKIDIPSDSYLSSIAYRSFSKSGLTTISLPDRLQTIKEYAFEDCGELTNVKLNSTSNLISLGEYAFKQCEKLESFYIPKSLLSFQANVFDGCNSLSSIEVNSENTAFATQDGIVYNRDKSQMLIVPKQISGAITLPETLTDISEGCFAYCDKITSLLFPESVSKIPNRCFEYCDQLVVASFLGEISEVGERAFYNCSSLLSAELGDSLTSIGESAFENCIALKSMSLPASLNSLGKAAFKNCASLETLDISEDATFESIGEETFYNCSLLKEFYIPYSVTAIHSTAFDNMHSLEEFKTSAKPHVYEAINGVLHTNKGQTLLRYPEGKKDSRYVIQDSVKSMKMDAFKNNKFIETVAFAYNAHLASYPNYAFSGCTNLKTVNVPKSMTTLSLLAFDNCPSLEQIIVNGANMVYSSYKGVLYTRNRANIIMIPEAISGQLEIAKEVEELDEYVISELKNLNSLVFQADSVLTTIRSYAISDCPELYDLTLPVSLMTIENKAFHNLNNLDDISFNGTVEQFEAIDKAEGWLDVENIYSIHCLDGEYTL